MSLHSNLKWCFMSLLELRTANNITSLVSHSQRSQELANILCGRVAEGQLWPVDQDTVHQGQGHSGSKREALHPADRLDVDDGAGGEEGEHPGQQDDGQGGAGTVTQQQLGLVPGCTVLEKASIQIAKLLIEQNKKTIDCKNLEDSIFACLFVYFSVGQLSSHC